MEGEVERPRDVLSPIAFRCFVTEGAREALQTADVAPLDSFEKRRDDETAPAGEHVGDRVVYHAGVYRL